MTEADANIVILQRAQALIDLGRFAEAASTVRTALASDPDNADAVCLLAQAELMAGNDVAAFESAQSAVKLVPDSAWAHRLLAVGYARFGNNEAEIAHAFEALRLEPHDPSGYICLSRALAREKVDLQQARSGADHAVRLAPHSVDAHMAVAFVADRAGDLQTAEAALRRVLAIDPEHSAAHNDLARLQFRASRRAMNPSVLADAAGGFATSVRSNPTRQIGRLNLDIVIRVFLERTAYLIFIDAVLSSRLSANSSASLLPIAVLGLPVGYALRFLQRVGPAMRAHIAREIRVDLRLGLPVLATVIAAILIVCGALAPESAPHGFAVGAAVTVVIARVLLFRQSRALQAAATRTKLTPVIGTKPLWLIAAALAVTAAMLAIAYTKPAGGRPAELVAAAIAAAFAIAVGALALQRQR